MILTAPYNILCSEMNTNISFKTLYVAYTSEQKTLLTGSTIKCPVATVVRSKESFSLEQQQKYSYT